MAGQDVNLRFRPSGSGGNRSIVLNGFEIDTVDPRTKAIKPLPADDPKQRQPDIAVARDRLGWEPHVDIETGLKKTIEYFAALRAAGRS